MALPLSDLTSCVVNALEEIKGQDICVYNTEPITRLFDRVVIVSGTSDRQTRALASSLCESVETAGGRVMGVQGQDAGDWILVDLDDVIVHIMKPQTRDYYKLEELWGEHQVP